MYKKEIEDSWVYQGILQEGFEQGLQQGLQVMRRMLISYIEAHYPSLVELAKEQTGAIKNLDTLQQVTVKLLTLHTAAEVEGYLLSLGGDATKN